MPEEYLHRRLENEVVARVPPLEIWGNVPLNRIIDAPEPNLWYPRAGVRKMIRNSQAAGIVASPKKPGVTESVPQPPDGVGRSFEVVRSIPALCVLLGVDQHKMVLLQASTARAISLRRLLELTNEEGGVDVATVTFKWPSRIWSNVRVDFTRSA